VDDQARPGRVVIVGGGFAGLFAARALRGGPFSVTLIDETAQHVFQPLLYQCATGILSEGQITAPLRRLLRKAPQPANHHGRGDRRGRRPAAGYRPAAGRGHDRGAL
jgi:NADH dehydrogenase FAD-containing subunit